MKAQQLAALDAAEAAVSSSRTLLENPAEPAVEKPVLGVTAADVVQGSPVLDVNEFPESASNTAKELHRTWLMVQGLAESAKAIISTNTVAAAGLAMIAADVAETMPTGSGPGAAPNQIASEFAATALVAAKSGSDTAAGLIETAAFISVAAAQARRNSSLVIAPSFVQSPRIEKNKNVVSSQNRARHRIPSQSRPSAEGTKGKGTSYSEILALMFEKG